MFGKSNTALKMKINRHFPDKFWNGIDDSRRRGSTEVTGGRGVLP
jgi:hypothetical protein